jgi:flagellar hook-basal body complex protein FliE
MKVIRVLSIAAICPVVFSFHVALAQNDVGNFYMGKVKVDVIKTYSGIEILPKPESVVLQDFTVASGVVNLDESAAGRLHTRLFLRRNTDDPSTPAVLVKQVQTSFSKALISDLKKANIEANRSTGTDNPLNVPVLVISGEMTTINEGNKVKQVMVGLGRGGSSVQAHVVVSSVLNGRATIVCELNLKSESGKKLGALESVGGGSLALNAAVGDVNDRTSTVQADASRMAKGVAKQVHQFMVAQRWIPADAGAPDSLPLVADVSLMTRGTP